MIQLLDDRLMVLPIEAEEKIGSIVMPDMAKEKSQRGKVVAVGPGAFVPEFSGRRELVVRIDDVVYYSKYRGEEYKADGKTYTILREHDVIAVVERDGVPL